ncbi:hypothetical protein QMY03_09485 [Arthrobacter sp. KFRI-F3372]|uniref:hypothetical protein n=1 Tax=Arthrobacter oryzae TaxID=409290 RepID=UPI002787F963|nr:hypothetical protein [Arthrobacter oryzae]MDP9989197.1 hypothetical protein [Arthrobacter oryzae]WHP61109.1 hypothetical protein QMY03_09485 [Arthrobacter sp. KFRI-F3372]
MRWSIRIFAAAIETLDMNGRGGKPGPDASEGMGKLRAATDPASSRAVRDQRDPDNYPRRRRIVPLVATQPRNAKRALGLQAAKPKCGQRQISPGVIKTSLAADILVT